MRFKIGKQSIHIPSPFDERAGFTLIEMAVVLGVLSLILGVIWSAASKVHEAKKENNAAEELQSVLANMLLQKEGRTFAQAPGTQSNITSAMIAAKVVPSAYINPSNPALAINPWSLRQSSMINGGFIIWATGPVSFRLSFYGVSRGGCTDLLLKGTACDSHQAGCPVNVFTDVTSNVTSTAYPNSVAGWQATMGATTADNLCALNDYNGGNNSVEFDYNL